MSWRKCTLGDVLTLKRGHDLPDSARVPGDVPVVSSSGITGWHNTSMADPPGVVTGRYGTIGEVFFLDEPYWPLNTSLYVIDFKGNDPKFSAYLLRNTLRNYRSEKAAVPGVNRNVLHTLDVSIPDLQTQLKIVSTLSAYDDLIENNRRRIALLEEAARLLYREWFVHFRFPGHEHANFIDDLPEGWQRLRIDDVTSFLSRGISPAYDDEAQYLVVNQKCVRDRVFSLEPARRQKKEFKANKALQFLDVLINSTGTGTLGRVAQCWVNLPGITFDSHVTVARPDSSVDPYWFGYVMMEMESVFEDMGEGATNQKELAKSRIAGTTIVVPRRSLQDDFGSFASSTSRQIQKLIEQIQKLAQARDLLLPRLMSGELTV